MSKAKLIILSGPSGCGKGTMLKLIRNKLNIAYSVSATTRAPREDEIDGISYYFLSRDDFEKRIENGEMLEYTIYCGNYYGTLSSEVQNNLDNGRDVLVEIEVEGAFNAKKAFPDALMIFVLPPSMEILENRLRSRNTEDEEIIQQRIAQAKKEIGFAKFYDYQIINDNLDDAVDEFVSIFIKEKNN